MREIKFRAWDGADMYYGVEKAYDTLGKMASEPGGEETLSYEWCSFREVLQDAESVMQYTGLKDCNEVEIYEGDILDNGRVTFIVVWKDFGYWGADVINDPKNIPEDYLLHQYGASYKVIGNIHENPELLK